MTQEEKDARLLELYEEKEKIKDARDKCLQSQSQSMNGRSIQRPDLAVLNRMMIKVNKEIRILEGSSSSIVISYVVPK